MLREALAYRRRKATLTAGSARHVRGRAAGTGRCRRDGRALGGERRHSGLGSAAHGRTPRHASPARRKPYPRPWKEPAGTLSRMTS